MPMNNADGPRTSLQQRIQLAIGPTALLALAAGPAAGQGPTALPSDAQIASRVDQYMMRLEDLGHTGGVLVIRAGQPVLKRSYGLANRATGVVADTATVYNLGSITKQFTAAAVLRLEEQGKLRTTDSIARFFPDAPAGRVALARP